MVYGIQHLHDSYNPYKVKAQKLIAQMKEKIKQENIDIEQLFYKIDTDQSNNLDLVEFSGFVKLVDEHLPQNEVQAIYNYIDSNNDGSISLSEFKETMV